MVRLWRRFQLKENPHISIRSVCVHNVEILVLFPQRHSLGNFDLALACMYCKGAGQLNLFEKDGCLIG